jgi:hypothetical protein
MLEAAMKASTMIWLIPVLVFAVFAISVAVGVVLRRWIMRRDARPTPPAAPVSTASERRPVPSSARAVTATGPGGMIKSRYLQVAVDRGGLVVLTCGSGYSTECDTYCALRWDEVKALDLGTGVHDSIVSLYATTNTSRSRQHVMDAHALAPAQWATLGTMIAEVTDDRLRLDLRKLNRSRTS